MDDWEKARRRRIMSSPALAQTLLETVEAWPSFDRITERSCPMASGAGVILTSRTVWLSDVQIDVVITAVFNIDIHQGRPGVAAIVLRIYDLQAAMMRHCVDEGCFCGRAEPAFECMGDREGYGSCATYVHVFTANDWSPIAGYITPDWRTSYLIWDEELLEKIGLIQQREAALANAGRQCSSVCLRFLMVANRAAGRERLDDMDWCQLLADIDELAPTLASEQELRRKRISRAAVMVKLVQKSIFD